MKAWLKGGLVLLLILLPIVVAQSEVVGEPPSRYINSLYPWALILLIALLLTLPIFYLIKKLSLKNWLKGGIVAVTILILFLFLWGGITSVLNEGECGFWDAPGKTLSYCFIAPTMYGIIGIIPIFILGALVGFIIEKINSKKDISASSKGNKMGFQVGLVFAIIFLIFQVYHIAKELTRSYNPFPNGINLKIILNIIVGPLFGFVAILVFFVLVGWIYGKIKEHRK